MSELPIDRLRAGEMSDAEVVQVAAATVRMAQVHGHGAETFNALAARLELVRLTDPRQTRARSTYWPVTKDEA